MTNKEDPFAGFWKLDPQKSHFDSDHRLANASMHWEPTSQGYRMTGQKTLGGGRVARERPATFILDGKDHPIPGMPGLTAITSRPAPNTIEVESKNLGEIVGKASYVVSSDGKTLTASVSGIDAQQRSFHTVLVWDRLIRPKGATSMNRRPLGITVIAILFAANAAYFVVFAALALFDRGAIRSVLHALSPSGAGPEAMHMSMGRLLPLYYILAAGFTLAMAYGFWKLWNWVRIVVLLLLGLSLLSLTGELRSLVTAPAASAIALTALRLGLIVLVGWYLLRRPVRDTFHQRTPVGGAA